MQTLQIDKNNARKLYPNASTEFKQMLIDTFGKEFFSQKITDRVKSFEDACEVLGINPSTVLSDSDTPDEAAYKKLKYIVKALNEGWSPNWNDSNEPKYYPWFYMNKTGFRLYGVDGRYTGSAVGSRLCFQKRDVAEYAVKQFIDLYTTLFTA